MPPRAAFLICTHGGREACPESEATREAQLGPLNNQPLTIRFVGGFFFGASLLPDFGWKVGGN